MVNIKFELRFNKENKLHNQIKKCYLALIENVLTQYEEKTHKPPEDVRIYPVERLGHSGANVLYVNIANSKYKKVEKFIAKFDTKYNTKIEVENALKFNQHIYHSYSEHNCVSLDIGILLYEYVDKCDEFRDLFLQNDISEIKCSKYIDNLYLDFELNQEKNKTSRILFKDYIWYLDRKHKPEERMSILLDYYKESLNLNLINTFYDYLKSDDFMVNTYLVHGDIHARNILANERQSTLIDFAWVDNAHKMKDFTLLETSIKHMLINESLKYNPNHKRIYIQQNEYNKFLLLINNSFELCNYEMCSQDDFLNKVFLKAFMSIKTIRKYAKICLVDNKTYSTSFSDPEQEYFYSSFLILYGMLGMNTIDENSLVTDLSQIATKYQQEYL